MNIYEHIHNMLSHTYNDNTNIYLTKYYYEHIMCIILLY